MTTREQRRAQLVRDVEICVIHEAWLAGSAAFWERRAQELEAARPRRSDFTGNATPQELTARWQRLTEAAAACRRRGRLTWQTNRELVDTLADVGRPYDALEQQLRHALDAGDRPLIDRLSRLIDQADLAAAA